MLILMIILVSWGRKYFIKRRPLPDRPGDDNTPFMRALRDPGHQINNPKPEEEIYLDPASVWFGPKNYRA